MKNENQIKGQIADTEAQQQQLAENHTKMVASFNQAVQQNQAAYHQLQGRLATLRDILAKPAKEKSRAHGKKK